MVNEWAGILQWAVDGALDWQLNGLDIPGIIKQASDAYLDDEDLLGQFLTDCVEKATGSFVTTTALHDANDVWRREQGLTPWSARALQGALVERGMTPKRTNQGRGFVGLKLLPNAGTFQVVGG